MEDIKNVENVGIRTDVEEILEDAISLLKPLIKMTKSHYYETQLKSNCQVSIDFSMNKDGEHVIKYVPKKNLPIETLERTGEFNEKGELILI